MATAPVPKRDQLGQPYRPFLYTLEQIQDLLLLDDLNPFLYYDRRSVGIHHPPFLRTINLSPDGVAPAWRVEEEELIRWMHNRGFRVMSRYERRR